MMKNNSGGKGSAVRPLSVDNKTYNDNFDRIFGKKKNEMTEVRRFKIGDHLYTLKIDLSDDHTEVFKEEKSINLKFDSSTNVIYNDRVIGKLRYSYTDEENKTIKFKLNVKEDIIDTGVSEDKVESFLIAEVLATKYLIENSLINTLANVLATKYLIDNSLINP